MRHCNIAIGDTVIGGTIVRKGHKNTRVVAKEALPAGFEPELRACDQSFLVETANVAEVEGPKEEENAGLTDD